MECTCRPLQNSYQGPKAFCGSAKPKSVKLIPVMFNDKLAKRI